MELYVSLALADALPRLSGAQCLPPRYWWSRGI